MRSEALVSAPALHSVSLQLFLKLAIKCSDVGHAVKKWEMHDLWSQRVVQVVVWGCL